MSKPAADQTDKIAAVQHEIWTHWMRFLLSAGEARADGSVLLPAEKVARWRKQMDTPYASLPATQKASDRDQAAKVLAVLGGEDGHHAG